MQITIIRVYLRIDEGECLLWGMNRDVGNTVGDNRGRETEKTKTKNLSERVGL